MPGSRSGEVTLDTPPHAERWLDHARSGLALLSAAASVLVSVSFEGGGSALSQAVLLSIAFAGVLLACWDSKLGAGGGAFLYFVIFALFHGGLVFAYAQRGPIALLGGGDNSWIAAEYLGPAVSLTVIGAASATVGVLVGRALPDPRDIRTQCGGAGRLSVVGGFAAAVGFGMIVSAVLANGGLGGVAGYIQFLELVAGESVFSYGSLLLGLGLCLLVACGGRSRFVAWGAMLLLAAVALPLGLRGPVLFPLVTMVMIESKRRRLHLWLFLLVSIAVLCGISVIRQTRAQGLSGLLEGGWTRIDPFDGAAEMGYSLYPVVQVEQWMSSGTEPMNGVTFVAPLVRAAERVLGMPSPPGDQDMRLFNAEVFARIGPIGGSPIAEGYRNFETVGVVVVMCLLGLVLARIDRLHATPAGAALAASIMLPIVTAVRNSFAPIVPQILIGLALVAVSFVSVRGREGGPP